MSFSGLLGGDMHVSVPSPKVTSKLKELLPRCPFHISASEADRLASSLGISKYQLMMELIPIAKEFAASVVPVSHFSVGSCSMGTSGDLYLGTNMEFGGVNLAQTVHSEQSTSANAMVHGEKGILVLAVSSVPCGLCRQFLNELALADKLLVITPDYGVNKLEELLPHSFGPKDLDVKAGMMAAVEEPVLLEGAADELDKIALEAANRTYAPYSHCNAGVALRFSDGSHVSGFYAENAAFNPSLSPMQAALIMTVGSGHTYADIARAVLVERKGCLVTHKEAFTSLFKAVAPAAELSIRDGIPQA